MELKLNNTKITKLDFDRLVVERPKEGQTITVKIKLEIDIKNISKIKENDAMITSNFLLDMEGYAKFIIETETNITSKDIDKIIDFWKGNDEHDLPNEISHRFTNAIFFFVMPEIILIAEKARIPVPLPPLDMPTPFKKVKQTKPKTKK